MKRLLAVLAIVAFTMGGSVAQATPLIDFGTGLAGKGGTITDTGSEVIGAGILIGALTVDGLGAMDGVYLATGTGSGNFPPNPGVLNFTFGAGISNYIEVVGGVADLSVPDGTLLLSGSFTSFSFMQIGDVFEVHGIGTNMISPLLLTALGIPVDTPFQFSGFSVATDQLEAYSTDLTSTPVPEPGSLLLLGTGLLGLAGVVRRRKK